MSQESKEPKLEFTRISRPRTDEDVIAAQRLFEANHLIPLTGSQVVTMIARDGPRGPVRGALQGLAVTEIHNLVVDPDYPYRSTALALLFNVMESNLDVNGTQFYRLVVPAGMKYVKQLIERSGAVAWVREEKDVLWYQKDL